MCTLSMVHDHYNDQFKPYGPITTTGTGYVYIPPDRPIDMEKLEKLVNEFKEAVAAATKLDALLKQPDCVDPVKADLQERVAVLERLLLKNMRKKAKK